MVFVIGKSCNSGESHCCWSHHSLGLIDDSSRRSSSLSHLYLFQIQPYSFFSWKSWVRHQRRNVYSSHYWIISISFTFTSAPELAALWHFSSTLWNFLNLVHLEYHFAKSAWTRQYHQISTQSLPSRPFLAVASPPIYFPSNCNYYWTSTLGRHPFPCQHWLTEQLKIQFNSLKLLYKLALSPLSFLAHHLRVK